ECIHLKILVRTVFRYNNSRILDNFKPIAVQQTQVNAQDNACHGVSDDRNNYFDQQRNKVSKFNLYTLDGYGCECRNSSQQFSYHNEF
ncbi:unnamed protein product, partial [Rotaria sp. Silwood1]